MQDAFRFKAGQHLSVRAEIGGEEVRRNYSLCVAPDEGQLMVTVKRIAGGVFSNWVGDNLKAGDTLDVMTPHGSFTIDFDPAAKRRYVAFAGGSGITPVISLIKTALSVEPDSRFTLFYGNRDASSIIFLEELAALKDRYIGRFELYHFLSDEEGDVELFNGMLDRETCDEAIDRLVDDPRDVDAWFICGPGPDDGRGRSGADRPRRGQGPDPHRALPRRPAVGGAGRADGAAAGESGGPDAQRHARRAHPQGRVHRSQHPRQRARGRDLPAPFACKAGVCATCRAKVTKGKVEMAARYGLTDEEIAAGYVLTCQSVPVGEGVAVDYDA